MWGQMPPWQRQARKRAPAPPLPPRRRNQSGVDAAAAIGEPTPHPEAAVAGRGVRAVLAVDASLSVAQGAAGPGEQHPV